MSDGSNDIVEGFWVDFLLVNSDVSIFALALYDYSITFDLEVEHIWKGRFNLSSAIFIVNRYFTIFTILAMIILNLFSRTRLSCLGIWFSASMATTLVKISVLCFFVVRTWAIWGRHPLPLVVLTPLALGIVVVNAVLNFPTTWEGVDPLQSPYGGCDLPSPIPYDILHRIEDVSAAINFVFSFLVLIGTLAKTLKLKKAASQAGIKGNLVSLLIRDGTMYLCLTFFLDMVHAIIFNVDFSNASIEVLAAPVNWLRHIVISRMILDLKSIDQVSMASLPEIQYSHFSSIHFIGNIGAPLGTMDTKNDGDEEAVIPREATVTRVSARQIIEDPLSIGLLDGKYNNLNVESERNMHPSQEPLRTE